MKMQENERGYALLLVLFLVVFIMAITAVFMRGAISNAKQEQIVDKNNLAVVAAEMGVEYYEMAIANEYYNKIDILKDIANAEIAGKNIDEDINYGEIRKTVTKELRGHLETRKAKLGGVVELAPTYRFSLGTWEFVPEEQDYLNGIIIITGTVKGEKIKKEGDKKDYLKELEYKQTFLVPSFDPAVNGGSGNGGGNNQLPPPKPDLILGDYYNELSKNTSCKGKEEISGEICKASQVGEIKEESEVFVGEVLNTKHEVKVNSNSKLYINGAFNGEHKLDVANSAVYVGGVLTATNDIAVNGSKLYVTGALSGSGKLEVDKSTIYVGGALAAANDIDINNSAVYVGGALAAAQDLIVNAGSNFCVAGALSVTKKLVIGSNSRVYVIGAVSYGSINKADRLIKVANIEELKGFCGAITNEEAYIWPEPTIDVTY